MLHADTHVRCQDFIRYSNLTNQPAKSHPHAVYACQSSDQDEIRHVMVETRIYCHNPMRPEF